MPIDYKCDVCSIKPDISTVSNRIPGGWGYKTFGNTKLLLCKICGFSYSPGEVVSLDDDRVIDEIREAVERKSKDPAKT